MSWMISRHLRPILITTDEFKEHSIVHCKSKVLFVCSLVIRWWFKVRVELHCFLYVSMPLFFKSLAYSKISGVESLTLCVVDWLRWWRSEQCKKYAFNTFVYKKIFQSWWHLSLQNPEINSCGSKCIVELQHNFQKYDYEHDPQWYIDILTLCKLTHACVKCGQSFALYASLTKGLK